MKKKTKGKIIDDKVMQAFTNCLHGYDRACNLHASGITHTRTFVHGIEFADLSNKPLCFKKIKTTTTIPILISKTLAANPCSFSTVFDHQSFAPLS